MRRRKYQGKYSKKQSFVKRQMSRRAVSSAAKGAKAPAVLGDLIDESTKDKYFEIFAIAVLLGFGIYHSILFFGQRPVPSSDFPAFVKTGHELLSFKAPSSFKRAPVLCILVAGLSKFVGGQHPDLTAGWLLNAILHPLNAVLLWLVGRRVVGKAALWISLVAIINPWVIRMLSDPIVEITLLFFVLLTFYFIFKRSRYSYLFASIATMVRYEGAALILAAFVIDMITGKSRKERLMAFAYAAAATLPLAIWLVGTFMRPMGSTHYLRYWGLGKTTYSSEGRIVLREYITMLWQVGFRGLFMPVAAAKAAFLKVTASQVQSMKMFFTVSQVLAAVSFVFGAVYGLCKRNWNILAMLILLVPYIVIHAVHAFIYHKFLTTVYWIALLICFFALQSCWKLINKENKRGRWIASVGQGALLVIALIWLIRLWPLLGGLSAVSSISRSIPYVGMGVAILIFFVQLILYGTRKLLRNVTIVCFVCAVIVSNQFALATTVRNCERNSEFAMLADWYIAEALPSQKLICGVPQLLDVCAPRYRDSFVSLSKIKADSPDDFVEKCRQAGITYVVWDTRMGLFPKENSYKQGGYKNITALSNPVSSGAYQFVTQLGHQRGFVNVFRLSGALPSE